MGLGSVKRIIPPSLPASSGIRAITVGFQNTQHLFDGVKLEAALDAIVAVENRCHATADLEHELEGPTGLQYPDQLGDGSAEGLFRRDVLDDGVAENEVHGGGRMLQGQAQIGHRDPVGDFGMKPAGLLDVLVHGVNSVHVVAPLPVEKDVAGPGAATGVQPPGARRHQFDHAVQQVVVTLEGRVGRVDIDGLYVVVADFGVTSRMVAVEGLGEVDVAAHGNTAV